MSLRHANKREVQIKEHGINTSFSGAQTSLLAKQLLDKYFPWRLNFSPMVSLEPKISREAESFTAQSTLSTQHHAIKMKLQQS